MSKKGGEGMDKGTFVKNTVILTGASLALRGVGMVFRVYLAAKIGAQGWGCTS